MDSLKDTLAGRSRKAKPTAAGKIHSEAHALADEISSAFGERKRFAMYLGTINRVGVGEARRIYSELRQESKGHLGKLFMYLCSKKAKEKRAAALKNGTSEGPKP